MKLGMTSLTLRNESPDKVVEYVVKAGLQGIEWGVSDTHIVLGDTHRTEKVARLCGDNNIEVFSLGSYCRMETLEGVRETVEAAAILGAPIIRIWAGTKAPQNCTDTDIATVTENTRVMADMAKKHGIVLGFEFHEGTLTETADDAVELIKRIDRPNVGLYWQPDYRLTPEENLVSRNRVISCCVGNMHIQNYTPEKGYGHLSEIESTLCMYYDDIKDKDYCLMIEFVKDGTVENLTDDSVTLRRVIGL